MKAILYSDLQLSEYRTFSKLTPEGINDRLIDHINVLEEIKSYAVDNKIEKILFLGDGFDSRGTISVIAANLFLKWKHEVSTLGITQYDLVGNHDLVAKSHSHNSLELFSKLKDVHVIDKPKWIIIGDTGLYFIPYMHRTDDIRKALENCDPPSNIVKEKSIAMMHYGLFNTEINGRVITEDKGVNSEGQVRLSDLDKILGYVKHVFLGHYHTHATYNGNVHYVGTPLQHNWGEASLPGRFLVVDFEDGSFEAVRTNAPRFIDFDNPNISKDLIKDNFCRASVGSLAERESKVKYFLEHGARAADVTVAPKVEKKISNTNMNLSMSFMDMGNKLLDIDSLDKYDRSKLERILKSALEFASEKVS
jgi:DNA repair exonuclease SbcCD nuclease subunit